MLNSTAPLLNAFSITRHKSPYPGLRPFGEGERDIFFGRDSQIREVIERLHANHFAAILGGSGSGKSSLVRAGMIPDLRSHALPGSSDLWLPVIFTPGEAPIERLAERLHGQLAVTADARFDIEDLLLQTRPLTRFLDRFQANIRFDEEGLGILGERTNLLVVVDQFEEIFRPQTANSVQAKALVRLIIETFREPHPRIYLVLTMRTEFLDHCTGSLELPDVLNATSYLTRRLNRAEVEEVIVEPAKRYLVQMLRDAGQKAEIDATWPFDPVVKKQLLNDVAAMSDDTDHLPLLQHCLYRLWDAMHTRWQASGRRQPARIEAVDLKEAVRSDGHQGASLLRCCLANHVDALYCGLAPAKQQTAAEMFKLLAEVDEQGIHKRRWTSREEIQSVTGADRAAIEDIVRTFSEPHPYIRRDKTGATEAIDVSHESFIRNWRRFRQWLEEDRALVGCYQRLLQESQDWQRQLERTDTGFWKLLAVRHLYRLDLKLIDRFVENKYIDRMILPWAKRHYDTIRRELGNNYVVDDEAHEKAVSYFHLSNFRRKWQRYATIGGGVTLGALAFVTSMVMVQNATIDEERRWLDIETKAFQPYAVASAVAGPALQEPEEWRPTRLWQAAMALRALEKLEMYVQQMPEPRQGLEFRQYRLERARRLAQSVSIRAARDIVGSSPWPKSVAPMVAGAAVPQNEVDVSLAMLSAEDQACVRSVLTPTQQQQFAELVRADIDTSHGVPFLIRYGQQAGFEQEAAYRVALGVEDEGTCVKLEDMQDRWSHLVYAPDLSMIVTSKQITGRQQGDYWQAFSVYRLNWYTYCEPRDNAPCRHLWRVISWPTGVLVRKAGAVVGMGADGRSFYVQDAAESGNREWFGIASFGDVERLDPDEGRRIEQQEFSVREVGLDAFGTDDTRRALLHLQTGQEIFKTPSRAYQIVAHAEAADHLAFVYSGMAETGGEGDRQASDNSGESHLFTILRMATSRAGPRGKEQLKQRISDDTQLNLMKHPIATFDFFGPPIEEMVLGSGENEGILYFRTEGDLYYRSVWGSAPLLRRVCEVLGEAGLDKPVEEALSPTFKMIERQEEGVIQEIMAEGGPCRARP